MPKCNKNIDYNVNIQKAMFDSLGFPSMKFNALYS
jgi:hypothetical protein